jgi:hypothetical protein
VPIQVALVIAIAVAFAAIVVIRQGRAWLRYRGQRVVTCPENSQPAGVALDARHAAATALTGSPQLRLTSCSRWPEKAGCGEPCLSQIALAPGDCLVRNIVAEWYQGKTCAMCRIAFETIDFAAAKPAMLLPGGESVGWDQVSPENLHQTMAQAKPICFGCHMATTMVKEHPEMVSDRSAREVVSGKS